MAAKDGKQSRPRRAPRRVRPAWFDAALCVISAVALAAVLLARVLPLSDPPAPPPDAVHIAWAGRAVRGYAETAHIDVTGCDQKARVTLTLYPSPNYRGGPGGSGAVAMTIDEGGPPRHHDVHIWQAAEVRPLARDVQNPDRPIHVSKQVAFRVSTGLDSATRQPRSVSYAFRFDPRLGRVLNVALDANWLSPRTRPGSCWVGVPSLINNAEADATANSVVRRAARSSGVTRLAEPNQPIMAGQIDVMPMAGSALHIEPATSIPPPTQVDPAAWQCQGTFASGDCQASAVLSSSGGDAMRARTLAGWSIAAGLLLAVFGDALVAVFRRLLVSDRDDDR